MKKLLACIFALVALVSVVSASAHVANDTNYWYWNNGECLGEPFATMWWPPIDPEGNNCSLTSEGYIYVSSSEACPMAPGTPWHIRFFGEDPTCSDTSDHSIYETQKCVVLPQQLSGILPSYFMSCLNDPPANPFVKIEQVASCGASSPAPTSVTRDVQADASTSYAIFSNVPDSCVPYYNNSGPSLFDYYASYVKISEVCDPLHTDTLDITFYNDSSCTHARSEATFSMGCALVPGLEHPIQLTCLAPNPTPGASTPTESPTAPTTVPTGSASPLSLSIALVSFLATVLAVLML